MPLVVESNWGASGESKPLETQNFSAIDLPADFPRKAGADPRRASKELCTDPGVAQETVRAVFQVLLQRYSGEVEDVTFRELLKRKNPARTADLALEGARVDYNADLFKPETIDRQKGGALQGIQLLGLLEQLGLVAFDLEQVIPAFFHDGSGVRPLAVQGVGGDDFAIQGGQFFQERV